MAHQTRRLARLAAVAAIAATAIIAAAKIRYGLASDPFVFTSTSPVVPAEALELVAELPEPPSNVAVSADGMYYGKYQFSMATWAAMGGSGSPAAAPESEQDMRAAMLYEQSGPGQWPVCGQ